MPRLPPLKEWMNVTKPHLLPLGVLLVVFALSRIAIRMASVVFVPDMLQYAFQIADPVLLKHDALATLYYLHGQPPAFNGLIALVLKAFSGHEQRAFSTLWLLMSFSMCVGTYAIALELRAGRTAAGIASCLFALSPALMANENWLFYPVPVALLLTLTILFGIRTIRTRAMSDLVLCFVLGGTLVWTRSLFHPLWLAGLVLLLVFCCGREWRRVLAAAMIPLLLVFALCMKNLIEFGSFGTSTWLGYSLCRMVTLNLEPEERRLLIEEKDATGVLFFPDMKPVAAYEQWLPVHESRGIAVLDQETKSTGHPNLHHAQVVEINRLYMESALIGLREYPGAWARSFADALMTFFLPSGEYWFLVRNTRRLHGYERIYNAALLGRFGEHTYIKGPGEVTFRDKAARPGRMAFFLLLFYAAVLFRCTSIAFICTRRGTWPEADQGAWLVIGFSLAWVLVFGTVFEVGENHRFRFATEPALYAAVIAMIGALAGKLRSAATTVG